MAIEISKVYNARLYLNGSDFIGKANEVDLPKVKVKFADVNGLGMYADAEVPIGLDKMEARFLMNSIYKEFVEVVSNPRKAAKIIVRSSITWFGQDGVSQEKPFKAELRGVFKDSDTGKFKKGESTEAEATMSVFYYKVEVDGSTVVEIDVFNNIYKAGGEDIIADWRANLGG